MKYISKQDLLKHFVLLKSGYKSDLKTSPWILPDGSAFKPSRDGLSEIEELKEVMVHWEKYEEDLMEADNK